ncbi:MAG: Holliday junction branch migration protein RuvA [Synechococcales cyanobacterium RM1_1_8]|nr:Holliday junction branch migration protein RuvA [Synechococcales cyanobacterium RM1_1_8]
MITFLKGVVVGIQRANSRVMLFLDVQGVGYEVQIVPRLQSDIPIAGETTQVFTHLQVREDQWTLFGFSSIVERDLFRQIIGVSGVGAQSALALLNTLPTADLVQAIVASNVRLLSQAPGIGKKTAERLALELRAKLTEWRESAGLLTAPGAGPVATVQEDVEMTLLALGYSSQEIVQALDAVGQQKSLSKTADVEDWIREAITWLSQS